jgi:enamine deaminase RidA (YjgF/YER057c/UK114 family)
MSPPAASPLLSGDCRVRFGGERAEVETGRGAPALRVALPVLAGAAEEQLLAAAAAAEERAGYRLFQRGNSLAGFAVAAPEPDLETATLELYRRLFAVTAGRHLYRICNYVPQINAHSQGLENYRHFCRGRSLAFEATFGAQFQRRLPAAFAVGAAAGPLAIGFLAGEAAPRHFENPRQVPAFEYPEQYGPRPPSFSRATAVEGDGAGRIFISGTAAVRGHASVADGDVARQLACTLENLALMGEATGAGPDLGLREGWRRSFKVFLRRPEDLGFVQAKLARRLVSPGDTVSYLRADLCRAELAVEIEATLAR